jgi:hypothetical protein
MQLGPSGSPRPDVYTLDKSYSRPMATAYECKISRSDLRSDTTSGKWEKYLAFAGAVIFAVPEGLCTPADIPAGCGLMVRKAAVWRHIRKATRTPVALPMDACMKLLIDGVSRSVERHLAQPRKVELWRDNENVRKKFGEAVGRAARNIVAAQTEAADLQRVRSEGWARVDKEVAAHKAYLLTQIKQEMAVFEQAKRDLIQWLGLGDDVSSFSVRRRLEELRRDCDADARVIAAEHRLHSAKRSLESALHAIAPRQEAAA